MTAPSASPPPGGIVSDLPIASGSRLATRLNAWGADARVREDFDNAAAAYEAAQWAVPGNPGPTSNLAEVLIHRGLHAEGVAAAELACRIDPDVAEVWYGLGKSLLSAGDAEAAIAALSEALRIDPNHMPAMHNLAICCLATGRLEAGWSAYRWRATVAHRTDVPRVPIPAGWKGRVVVACEQGLGDVLFFARWLPVLREKGAEEIWCAWPTKIAPLMRRAFPDVLEGFGDDGCVDVRMGDLPYLTQTPGPLPSIVVRANDDPFMAILPERAVKRPMIGVTWRAGAPTRKYGLDKKIDPEWILGALEKVGGNIATMQRGAPSVEDVVAHIESRIRRKRHWNWNSLSDDPETVLDILPFLNVYVTVSNTNVHLLAALPPDQRPKCHVLVTYPPELRWMHEGDESPWFPGIRVHRQKPDGSWPADMVQRIVEDIRA